MSNSRPITLTNNNSKGWVVVDWTQVLDDTIRYDTDNEEEVMKAKLKERKIQKAAEQAWWEEQAWLEAERVEREKAEAEKAERERAKAMRVVWEAEGRRAHEEEEKCKAEHKCKAEAGKGSEAGASGGDAVGEAKRVVMDHSCTCCSWAKAVCEFLMDDNKKWVACMHCNQSKGKCRWPRDGKDVKAGLKAKGKVNKGKKWKVDEENAEAGPSRQKQVKMSMKLTKVLDLDEPKAGRSGLKEAGMDRYLGLEDKLEHLIDIMGLIANNLAGLFELQEAASILNESYGFRVAVTPSDLGSSKLDAEELHKEVEWLQSKGVEEEAKGGDEPMAKAK
ncbi:hypothetical protein M404DRAFT_21087 [Pisolithus tinctorius Marx 270]|uniref:Uncharacterized protein n=1 Tax=Pisolithus tinctorius Marx 270 TaxID=870435 RepID=A0A0C3PPN3_PISTI|nr:hypothetical protein M404DRAFT_21087 [Pisolithus tinctorius Marx 270]